jgi:hypothetical protein
MKYTVEMTPGGICTYRLSSVYAFRNWWGGGYGYRHAHAGSAYFNFFVIRKVG